MKKKVISILCCGFFVTLAFTGCQMRELGERVGRAANGNSEEEIRRVEVTDDVVWEIEEELEETSSDTQRIGSPETGYVDVPDDFVTFVNDVYLGEGTIQYSDLSGMNIVTLQVMDSSLVDAELSANTMYMSFESDPAVDQETLTAAMVTLDGCEAYQVYCYYPDDDIYVVTWSFDSSYDDYTHYVAVEFTSDNYDLFEMVEDTYHIME